MPTSSTATTTAAKGGHKNVVHWQEVQDTVSRLASHKGVLAVSILNADGDIVTQQVTTAGVARSKSNAATNSGGDAGGASAAPAVVGNPKLLTKIMAAANLYVQSLSGNVRANVRANVSVNASANTGSDEAAAGEASNEEGDDESNSSNNKEEEISFVRIRTQKDEILVAPKMGYTLVVLQDPRMSSL